MKKIKKIKDKHGENVIYVEECTKYEYENQEIPKMSISDLHNAENTRINDILFMIENYYINN